MTLFAKSARPKHPATRYPVGTLAAPTDKIAFFTFNGDATWRDQRVGRLNLILIMGYDRLNVGTNGPEGSYYVIGLHGSQLVRSSNLYDAGSMMKAFTTLSSPIEAKG